jgi:hypothetical protein
VKTYRKKQFYDALFLEILVSKLSRASQFIVLRKIQNLKQWKLDKRDIFKRDFALSGRFFCALWICSQIILFMRDFPKCKREFPKFWPKAEFFFFEAVFRRIGHRKT